MIKNRIASTAALATFGLAALGGIALAGTASADTGSVRSPNTSSTSDTSSAPDATSTAATLDDRIKRLSDVQRPTVTPTASPEDLAKFQTTVERFQQRLDLTSHVLNNATREIDQIIDGMGD
jgi:hypothetical protein